MSELEKALDQVASALEVLAIPYMLIGGLAVSAWGEPRSTLDVDVTIWAPEGLPHVLAELCATFQAVVSKPEEFVRRTRVLPLISSQGVRIDVLFAAFPFEKEMIDRAEPRKVGNRSIPVATVEDLILLKAISPRDKDRIDVQHLWARFRERLDRKYLEGRLRDLAEALERPDFMDLLDS